MEKRYNLITAIAMVVGIVIGAGVFYKAQDVLKITNGNVLTGALAWVVGGVIMIIMGTTFAILATKFSKINGVVDYADATVGTKYGDFMAWFVAAIYYPAVAGVMAWLCARYTGVLFGWKLDSANVMTLGVLFLVGSYAINTLAPRLAGKIQVSTTVIKLIPLGLLAVVGTIYGLCNTNVSFDVVNDEVVKQGAGHMQILLENIKHNMTFDGKGFLNALVATAFAYEGWIIATSIAGEVKDSKKNLPKALLFGTTIIMIVYLFYYVGVLGGATTDVLMHGGAIYAFKEIFGEFFGVILSVFVVISCVGTLNGVMMANTRGFYTLAKRNVCPRADMLKKIDEYTKMPNNSGIIGLGFAAVWFVFFYGANISSNNWFGFLAFDSSELPIITIYLLYLPMLVMMIVKGYKELGWFKGVVMPSLALACSSFMVFAAIFKHGMAVLGYLVVFAIIMSFAIIMIYLKNKHNIEEDEVVGD